jgi:predicted DNA-binding transcriptional regulator AlpA
MARREITGKKIGAADHTPDELIPDPIVAKQFNVSLMTIWRWSHDADLGFPPAVQIRKRNFRSSRALEAFKRRMLRGAIAQRGEVA